MSRYNQGIVICLSGHKTLAALTGRLFTGQLHIGQSIRLFIYRVSYLKVSFQVLTNDSARQAG